MTIKFKELRIQRMEFGPDKDKIVATISIEGQSAQTKLIIREPASRSILQACAGLVINAVADQSAAFRSEFLDAISSNAVLSSNGERKGTQ